MLDTFVLVALERSLNALLRRDPATPSRLRELNGKTVRIMLTSPRLALRVAFHDGGVSLSRVRDWNDSDDLEIGLSPEAMERLVAGESLERLLFGNRLTVKGQTELLTSLQTLLLDLDLDWEGALAKGLGSGTAHGVASGLRHLAGQARFVGGEWRQDLREYLFEERRWLAGRDQLEVARDQLTELQQSVDRLGARVARLERQRESHS